MKTITQKGIVLLFSLFSAMAFAQGTGVTSSNSNQDVGIQNNTITNRLPGPSVLVVGSPGNPDWLLDVEAQLDGTGLVEADTFLSSAGTPTVAELQAYSAVLLFTDAGASDPGALGNNLAAYIDGGGAVVDATFTPNVPITGGFTAYELYSASGQSNGANLGIGTVHDPGHPTMNGVTSFDGGTASFHNTGGTVAAGASVVAEYTTGAPLIIVQENVGPGNAKRAFINFYPPSIDARDDFWNTTSDGAMIMANALLWTSGASSGGGGNVLIAASPGNPDWILDVEAKIEGASSYTVDTFLSNTGTPTLAELQAYDAVMVFTDAGATDPVTFGNNLAAYIEGGGKVLDATFTPNVPITGGFTAYELYNAAGQSNGSNLGIGTINVPGHPTMNGVSTFDGGTASFHNTGGTVAAGATIVAEYTDASPLIIVQENIGPANVRRAFLNFYPPSIDARDDFWDTTSDGATLMASTLDWLLENSDLPNVLVAASPGNPDWILDVESKLEGTGSFSGVDTFLTSTGTPTLAELQSYDAVYIFTDAGASDPVAFGNVLEQYIDGGGAVLDATFTPNVPITGGFTQYELYNAAGQSNGANLGIGTINVPGHPSMNGVSTFDGGTASFHNTGGTVAAGATVVAEYTDASPLIIVAENVGPANVRRAFLNFYPPSIDARDDFWDTTSDGATLMASTIYWLLDLSTDTNSAPTAVCQAFTATLDATGNVTITAANVDGGSSDTDGTITLSIDTTMFTCSDLGANTVTLTVTDDDGAIDTCTATVTVVDSTDPVLTCPADETVMVNAGDQYPLPDYVGDGDVTVTDNCTATIAQSPAPGTMIPVGTQTVTFTATDGSGNTDTCSFVVTVEEILGVNDANSITFAMYPNPATNEVRIATNSTISNISIYNLLGQKVQSSTSEIITISDLASGIYLVQIQDANGNKGTKKLIKK